MPVSFKTLKKHKVLIIKQPFIVNEIHTSGKEKGKVKSRRQVQYVEHLDSIYVEEQKKVDKDAKPSSIRINNGIITVEDDNPRLIEVLRAYPGNTDNGGDLFRELDVAKEEEYEIAKYEKLDTALGNIMDADENTLRAAAVFFLNPNYMNKKFSTLKIKLRETAQSVSQKANDPNNFVEKINAFFAEKNNNEKLTTIVAISEGIVKIVDGKKMAWADSDEVIFIAAQQKDVIKDFSVWLKTDEEGRQTLSVIADKIKKLKT